MSPDDGDNTIFMEETVATLSAAENKTLVHCAVLQAIKYLIQ